MKKESLSRLRKPLRIALSVSILVAGICLMAACLGIYHSGDQPYSREAIAAAFRPISLPVYICLGLILLSSLAELLLPKSDEKKAPARQTAMLLHRLQEGTTLSLCPQELRSEILSQRHNRSLYTNIGWTVLVLSSILFLTYGMNPHNFHQSKINESMIRAMYWLIPCAAVPFGYGIFAARKNLASMEQEIQLLKSAPKECKVTPKKPRKTHPFLAFLRIGLLAVGVLFLVGGFLFGGTADVLTKAVNICTECIGLG